MGLTNIIQNTKSIFKNRFVLFFVLLIGISLGNYFINGKFFVQTLPNLQQYHAIVTGKAVKANIPIIIDLKRIIWH
jgi:hypothetical protein